MLRRTLFSAGAALALALTGGALDTQAGHDDDPRINDMHPPGHDILIADLGAQRTGNPDSNTDLAFQGLMAVQGDPHQISLTRCDRDQGDVSV